MIGLSKSHLCSLKKKLLLQASEIAVITSSIIFKF
jgi:hypothetical protein